VAGGGGGREGVPVAVASAPAHLFSNPERKLPLALGLGLGFSEREDKRSFFSEEQSIGYGGLGVWPRSDGRKPGAPWASYLSSFFICPFFAIFAAIRWKTMRGMHWNGLFACLDRISRGFGVFRARGEKSNIFEKVHFSHV
jgi:hypothetical protein